MTIDCIDSCVHKTNVVEILSLQHLIYKLEIDDHDLSEYTFNFYMQIVFNVRLELIISRHAI